MSASLKLTHKAIGVEARRGTYDVVVDSERVGPLEMNDTIELPIEAGHHTLEVRNGRNLSRTLNFDSAEGLSAEEVRRPFDFALFPLEPVGLTRVPILAPGMATPCSLARLASNGGVRDPARA